MLEVGPEAIVGPVPRSLCGIGSFLGILGFGCREKILILEDLSMDDQRYKPNKGNNT
jgi:hypothetical protein